MILDAEPVELDIFLISETRCVMRKGGSFF